MQRRIKKPNPGQWNGLGGKMSPGESIIDAMIREFWEESGIQLNESDLQHVGIVTWHSKEQEWLPDGMHLFLSKFNSTHTLPTLPQHTREGLLEFKPLDWALSPTNKEIFSNIPHFLSAVLSDPIFREYKFTYDNSNQITSFEQLSLAKNV